MWSRPASPSTSPAAMPNQPGRGQTANRSARKSHNGNRVNAGELRDELVGQGSIFQSSTDTEVVLHLYARSRAANVDAAIVESVSQVRGAFSFLMLTRDRLIAVRDPHGFRPLALG